MSIPPNKFDELMIFTITDHAGNENICVGQVGGFWEPMIASDMARVEKLRPHAREVARLTGLRVALYRFTKGEELEVIE